MKVLVACTIYMISEEAREEFQQSFKTFNRNDKDYSFEAYETVCTKNNRRLLRRYFRDWHVVPKNCLGMSWNMALQQAILEGYDYVIFPNLDIRLYAKSFAPLVRLFDENCKKDTRLVMGSWWSDAKGLRNPKRDYIVKQEGMNNYDTYACFVVEPKRLVKEVGYFSERYVAYHGDMDMEHRIGLAGCKHKVYFRNPDTLFHHTGQVTLRTHPEANWAREWLANQNVDNKLFRRKWGDEPRKRLYKHPYNDKKIDHKFIGEYK